MDDDTNTVPRWKAAFHIVRAIGNRRKLDELKSSQSFNSNSQLPIICAVCPDNQRDDDDDSRHCDGVIPKSNFFIGKREEARNVDPIYLALKEANRMATNRRLSLASSPSPVGHMTPSDSMKELTASPNGKSLSRNSPALMQSVSSTPSLVSQKSTEFDSSRRSSITTIKPSLTQRRPPKLEAKMKSLSLDCPDAKGRSKNAPSSTGYSPVGRRVLKVRPCKNGSFETSDEGASVSCSPSPSPYRGSMSALPSSLFVVTHDHRAKFAEEIDLSAGERVFVFDTGDADWWQGQNYIGQIGIFPSTCVSNIYSNERVMRVVQNLNLWDGSKSLRLYRDQIVFAQQAEPDGLVEIRTEHGHRINCPVQYLMCLD